MKKSRKKKIVIITAISTIFFVLLLVTAQVVVNLVQESIIDSIIKKIVKKSDRINAIKYDSVDLDFFKRSIVITNLRINPDSETAAKFRSTLPVLEIEGISYRKLIFNKSLYITKLLIKNGEIIFPEKLYTLKAKEIKFSRSRSSLSINLLELLPKYERYRFSRARGYRSNRMLLKVKNILLFDINLKELFKKRRFHAKSLRIKYPQLDVFRDKNVPKRKVTKKKKFPQELLRDLKVKLRIDEIKISKGKIIYAEHEKKEKRPGKLSFTAINANLKNVTNFPELLDKKTSLVLTGSTKLMDKSIFQVKITAPIKDRRNIFKFSGSLGKIRMNEFHSMLENIAQVRIRRGVVDQLTFSGRADNYRALGEMRLLYNNLRISVLKKGGSYKKKKFISFLTNTIILNSNPRPGRPIRVGKISYKKEEKNSFFGYIWDALLSGIKSSIGLRRSKRR